MADQSNPQDVLQAMDRLWFSQNIMKRMHISISEAPPPSASLAEENSTKSDMGSTATSTHQSKVRARLKTPTLNIVVGNHPELQSSTSKTRSFHSLPRLSISPRRRLENMRSCKSFYELEHEELKGFRDLGFIFNKEELNPHIKSMLPGLQMLGEKQVTRPYLSEAWLINRPDSPLLNLRIPSRSASSGADMKKQLRYWARTVASVINQESSNYTFFTSINFLS